MLRFLAALAAAVLIAQPASAQQQVRIGVGYGLAFLPIYICQDLKLVEKHAKDLHLSVRASYQRFSGVEAVQDALATGSIDIGPFGVAPLLKAWDEAKTANNKQQQILAVSGMTTLPLALLSNRPNVRSIADLRPTDRIAMSTLTAPQMYFLQMQSEKTFGQVDRLRGLVVALSPADALDALFAETGSIDGYFSSPPYTEIALKDKKIHSILGSEQVIGGKASFLVLGATEHYVEAHKEIPQAIDAAIDEAAHLIHDNPRRAAQIYLAHEPSKALDAGDIEAVLRENKEEFGSAVDGIAAFIGFMTRHGELKKPPQSWKDVVAPALLNSPSG
jgi:NitT/TauT family transport system substrate-binding protein